LNVDYVADIFEASFYELSGFFDAGGGFADVVVAFEGYELRVDERVLDILTTEKSHYMENVFCFGVFHSGFSARYNVDPYPRLAF